VEASLKLRHIKSIFIKQRDLSICKVSICAQTFELLPRVLYQRERINLKCHIIYKFGEFSLVPIQTSI